MSTPLVYTPDTLLYRVPQVGALDYDRTLVDIEASFATTLEVAAEHGVDADELRAAKEAVESDGESFVAFATIAEKWGAETAQSIATNMGNIGALTQMHPDAIRLLTRLGLGSAHYFAMSASTHFPGQYGKILSSSYTGGIMLTPTSDKGAYQETFLFDDGYRFYRIGTPLGSYVVADEVCLIDDSEKAFANWQGPGFLIDRGKPVTGKLPPNVQSLQSLDELDVTDSGVVYKKGSAMRAERTAHVARGAGSIVLIPYLNPEHPLSSQVWVGETL